MKCSDLGNAIVAVHDIMRDAKPFHPMRWQGLEVAHRPDALMYEQLFVNFEVPMPTEDLRIYRELIGPNLPWADDHFEQERVSGEPINPGETYKQWPSAVASMALDHNEGTQFNHSYAERYWPRWAGMTPDGHLPGNDKQGVPRAGFGNDPHRGIRHEYGDLAGVVRHLVAEPTTRQAYLPVWFPEDTGDAHTGRKPCTIGYHFIMRDGKLNVTYQIRSCDFVRHFRDDVYLTVRLVLWVLAECRARNTLWYRVKPGTFRMDIGSLHCFVNDWNKLYKEAVR